MKNYASIRALAELALKTPEAEPLVVYDAVDHLCGALPSKADDESPQLLALQNSARSTATAIREADRAQTHFFDLLNTPLNETNGGQAR